ncbi:MAG: ferredoxin-type protein NapF [Alphaproteobacteria bacterium]|nr:ferredoxin-type protein NapF [Alphaproteobacteria bacterium]
MDQYVTRSAVLRGRLRPAKIPRRPPWAIGEVAFVRACTSACEATCVDACPQNILVPARDGRPEARFDLGECTFCADCAEVCPSGALKLENVDGTKRAPWALRAIVANRCLAIAGVTCRSCGDACGEDAIRFKLGLNGAALPVVDEAACTGCGACVRPCPVDAITLHGPVGTKERAA